MRSHSLEAKGKNAPILTSSVLHTRAYVIEQRGYTFGQATHYKWILLEQYRTLLDLHLQSAVQLFQVGVTEHMGYRPSKTRTPAIDLPQRDDHNNQAK